MKHACPACNCHLGQYAMIGWKGGKVELEGIIAKNIRLARDLRLAKQEIQRLSGRWT